MRASALIDAQCFGLTPRAVEREHQLAAQALAQRMLTDQCLELANKRSASPERKIRVDSILQGGHARLLQTRQLALGERFIDEVRERLAPPQGQRISQAPGRAARVARKRPATFGDQRLEPMHIDVGPIGIQHVAARAREHHAFPERLAQLRDVHLDRLRGGCGSALPPQLLDQAIARDDLTGMQEQDRQWP